MSEDSKLPDIYTMKLHEIIITEESNSADFFFTTAMRVPGGWIYRSFDTRTQVMSSVFVRFDNEFMY